MEFFAYHGHFEEETRVGNYFNVNLEFETDTRKAGESDCLDDALNYVEVYNIVDREMEQPSKLLENVARRIMRQLYAQYSDKISNVRLEVEKMNPPLGGKIESVSVVLQQ